MTGARWATNILMNEKPADYEATDKHEYPHWNRVYAVVVIYTIIVIGAIWLFSKQFQ